MSICKLSFAKSRSFVDPARGTGASETADRPAGWGVQAKRGQIPRNEAYKEVRRGDLPCQIGFTVSRSENLPGRGMRVTQPFDLAQGRELVERLVEWQMGAFRQPHYLAGS
jgi:hypothetical protein